MGCYLNRDPRVLRYCSYPYGKPSLAQQSGGGTTLSFNVTYAGGMALYAVMRRRAIGIHLEEIPLDGECDSIAEHFFSATERRILRAVSPDMRPEAFFRCWTCKEAHLKASCMGLLLALDQFDVSISPQEPAALIQTREDGRDGSRWSLHVLP